MIKTTDGGMSTDDTVYYQGLMAGFFGRVTSTYMVNVASEWYKPFNIPYARVSCMGGDLIIEAPFSSFRRDNNQWYIEYDAEGFTSYNPTFNENVRPDGVNIQQVWHDESGNNAGYMTTEEVVDPDKHIYGGK